MKRSGLSLFSLTTVSLFLMAGFPALGETLARPVDSVREIAPRVAIWNPEKPASHVRVQLFEALLDHAAESLRRSGAEVERLSAEELADGARFDADRFDLVIFPGEVIPGVVIPALRQFTEAGGVVMNLGGKLPFANRLAKRIDGTWTVSPESPAFAWQTDEILGMFGLSYVYSPPHHDQAQRFTATPLLKRYLPTASDVAPPLENWWIPTKDVEGGGGGEYFPLIRSQRLDGVDVTPQLAVVRCGRRHAILCLNSLFTVGTKPEQWSQSDALLMALARIAHDLRTGSLSLTAPLRVNVPASLRPPPPLRTQKDTPGVTPESRTTETIVQFGRFNNSSLDLDTGALPPTLAPGKTVTLDLPPLSNEGLYLRMRGAYAKSGAALCVLIGTNTVFHEVFLMPDASGASNLSAGLYDGAAAPFLRIAFVPPAVGVRRLTLSNSGTEPLYFDAVRLERRTDLAPLRWMGQYAGFRSSMPDGVNTIPTTITRRWSVLRCDLRGQFIGPPGDPARWDKLRRHLDKFAEMSPRWNLILMGTPEWAAISPERYAQGQRDHRAHCVPPDEKKYAEIIEWVVNNYGQYVALYEIWNEADIDQFWRGTTEEYLAFAAEAYALLHRLAPETPVILAGPAGIHARYIDAVLPTDLSKRTFLVPLHPYAGQSAGWDIPEGLLQGLLYAQGLDQEIYCNESGFVWKPGEWFRDPAWNPQSQEKALSTALARLLATDLAKLTVFLAGGDDHHFGVYDAEGHPRPAAAVIEDYLGLALNGGRRLDVSLTGRGGSAVEGVYAAASVHDDGSITMLLNPVEAPALQQQVPAPNSAFDVSESASWTTFWGKTEWTGTAVKIMPEASRKTCGFYRNTMLDPARFPELEVSVSEAAGPWTLLLKFGNGDDPIVLEKDEPGVFRTEYASKLKNRSARPVEISFRATNTLGLDQIRFITPNPENEATPHVSVVVTFPLPRAGIWQATAREAGKEATLPLSLHEQAGQHWATIEAALNSRTLIRVTDKTKSIP